MPLRPCLRARGVKKFDLYPPMHGIGLAEAESPYPDENATYPFRAGMCVNSDISLLGTRLLIKPKSRKVLLSARTDCRRLFTPLIQELCAAAD